MTAQADVRRESEPTEAETKKSLDMAHPLTHKEILAQSPHVLHVFPIDSGRLRVERNAASGHAVSSLQEKNASAEVRKLVNPRSWRAWSRSRRSGRPTYARS